MTNKEILKFKNIKIKLDKSSFFELVFHMKFSISEQHAVCKNSKSWKTRPSFSLVCYF